MCAVAKRLWADQDAATAIEYGLIAALISVFIIGAVTAVGSQMSSVNGPLVAAANAL